MAAAHGAELDPATAAELRPLRALLRRQAQELDILKKDIAISQLLEAHFPRPKTYEPLPLYPGAAEPVSGAPALPGSAGASE